MGNSATALVAMFEARRPGSVTGERRGGRVNLASSLQRLKQRWLSAPPPPGRRARPRADLLDRAMTRALSNQPGRRTRQSAGGVPHPSRAGLAGPGARRRNGRKIVRPRARPSRISYTVTSAQFSPPASTPGGGASGRGLQNRARDTHGNAQGCICSEVASLACAERRPHACALLHKLLQRDAHRIQ